MHEVGKTNNPEHESDREFQLATTILDRVKQIIENDPDKRSLNLDMMQSDESVTGDSDMDRDLRSTALFYVSNRHRLTNSNMSGSQSTSELVDADFSIIFRWDPIEETSTHYTFTNIYTDDGGTGRAITIVTEDEFIQKSYLINIDRLNRLETNHHVGPLTKGLIKEVYRHADHVQMTIVSGILSGQLSDDTLEYALDQINELAQQVLMPYEIDDLMQQLRDRHEAKKAMSDFHDTVAPKKMSEYDLIDLLDFIATNTA
jgi:hypothetical protein